MRFSCGERRKLLMTILQAVWQKKSWTLGTRALHPNPNKLVSRFQNSYSTFAWIARVRRQTKRQFDVVMAWNIDRLGRSLKDLVAFLSELHALGIDLFLHQQGLDTTTPTGKAMFQMLGVFAEFERSIIQTRN